MRCKRGTFAKQRQPFVPQINVRITEEQLLWLSSQVKPFRNKSAVIRDLIDSRIQGVDADAKLSAYHVGAGRPQGNSRPLTGTQPSPEQPLGVAGALQIQQSLPQPTTVDSVPAQKIEDEKNTINVKNQKKARKPRAKATKGSPEFEAFWKRYQACQHLVQSQPKGAALEQWEQIVPDEVSADDLMRAIEAADQESQRRSTPDWEQRLPMCSKWLKDGYYCTYLEEKQPQERKPSWML